MGYDLSGKVVAITGASSGIGAATALLCAQSGAAVALGARRADRIEALAERIEAEGGAATAIPCDVASEEQATGFVQEAKHRLGRLDAADQTTAGVMLLGPSRAPTPASGVRWSTSTCSGSCTAPTRRCR